MCGSRRGRVCVVVAAVAAAALVSLLPGITQL